MLSNVELTRAGELREPVIHMATPLLLRDTVQPLVKESLSLSLSPLLMRALLSEISKYQASDSHCYRINEANQQAELYTFRKVRCSRAVCCYHYVN